MTIALEQPAESIQPPTPLSKLDPQFLFVYGTLMPSRTHMLEHLMTVAKVNAPLTFVEGITKDHYLRRTAHYPTMLVADTHSGKAQVRGELVSLKMFTAEEKVRLLKQLDIYEGVPNLYTRRVIPVLTGDTIEFAYAYVFADANYKGPMTDWTEDQNGYKTFAW